MLEIFLSLMRFFAIICLFILIYRPLSVAANDITIKIFYLKNHTHDLSAILKLNDSLFAKVAQGETLNLGYTDSAVWIKIVAEKNTLNRDWRVNIPIPYIDTLTFFYPDSTGHYQSIQTGFHTSFDTRGNNFSDFVFPITISKYKEVFYVRIATSGPMILPIYFEGEDDFFISRIEITLISGLFFGVLIAISLYNLLIYISLRDPSYGFNTLSMFSLVMVMACAEGYAFKYLWPSNSIFNIHSFSLSMIFLGIFSALTARSFLESKIYSRSLDKLILLFVYIGVLLVVITLFFPTSFYANQYLTFTVPFYLITGVVCWKNGNRTARFFILGWFFYILGGVLVTLRNLGVLPYNFWTTYTSQMGSALEAILLAFALSDRYRLIKQEKQEAMQRIIESELKNSRELESKVKQRTLELNEANSELYQVVEKLNETLSLAEKQKVEIERSHSKVLSSINYARRIQSALLPTSEQMNIQFGEGAYFIFNRPKDILSGDFYFTAQVGGYTFVVVGDCTGHGVSGALMSIIGMNLLNEIIYSNGILDPSNISEMLEYRINKLLYDKNKISDSIETAIVRIDKKQLKIDYLIKGMYGFLLSNGDIEELERSRSSIHGVSIGTKFIQKETFYLPSSILYLASDGIFDQFGGHKKQKFGRKRFISLIQRNASKLISKQEEVFQTEILNYISQGKEKQVDDILVFGLRL